MIHYVMVFHIESYAVISIQKDLNKEIFWKGKYHTREQKRLINAAGSLAYLSKPDIITSNMMKNGETF